MKNYDPRLLPTHRRITNYLVYLDGGVVEFKGTPAQLTAKFGEDLRVFAIKALHKAKKEVK